MKIKDIPFAPNYFITDQGEVFSKNYRGTGRTQKLKLTRNERGYLTACLWVVDKKKNFYVHRLVAMTFIPNLNKFPQVNHKDTIKSNNSKNNLEWCTNSYNHLHAYRNGRKSMNGERSGSSKLTEIEVLAIRKRFAMGNISQKELSVLFDVAPTTVTSIINRKTWKHI